MQRYSGKSAVVIGGTHGMGWETARQLLDHGATVLVTGSHPGRVEAARASLGERALVLQSDVSQPADIAELAARVREALGGVDALFVFAGIAGFEAIEEVSAATFDRQFAVNARGAFFVMQALAGCLRDGASITLTTVTPATATPGMSVYMGSKAAVSAFVRGFAAELLPRRIRVNAIAPGFIDTPTLGLVDLPPDQRAEFSAIGDAVTPMQRHGSMDEVARAALFLAFDATFCTGIELPVDGGLSTVDAPNRPDEAFAH